MDSVTNSFSPNAGSMPPELVGRDGVLEDARILLGRTQLRRSAQSLLMTGLRGVARASLIRKGMIYSPAHGSLAFTVPLFGEYIKRVMPTL